MLKAEEITFIPGVYTKCACTIDSCVTFEQLVIAERLVSNNKHLLTEAQYAGLKRKILRHPEFNNLVNTYLNEQEKTIVISKPFIICAAIFGCACWATFFWWLL